MININKKKLWPLIFHQKTVLHTRRNKTKTLKQIPDEWKKTHYKAYARFCAIKLPKPPKTTIPLTKALTARTSSRNFSSEPITPQNLSFILFNSAGEIHNTIAHRTYPSAGARYPLETYVIALNVENMPRGIYHYYVRGNILELLSEISPDEIPNYFLDNWVNQASALIMVTGVMKRTTVKYGDRGYRYVLTEAGHLGQNVYLTSAAQSLGCCAIGGFTDKELAQRMRLDPTEEPILYIYAVGKTKKP